ncbi:hypothetical protein [Pedobacter nutrimenti]|uniref:Uncharacterized protein n=1 Tax=Pedobacter nutrimenti TaxID=1241337 RepID=A0A318UCU0_9SPHI|nr:hypothetical protein [Pedobacter nutrimenti]PYF73903.1 hypothetical protein B0O44_10473 [Pedobacter nutrimenti]
MKIKLTPLNLVSASFLVIAAWLLINKQAPDHSKSIDLSKILIGFSLLIVVVAFISDQIFRKFIPELKKIWIIESVFIIFAVLLFFIIRITIV